MRFANVWKAVVVAFCLGLAAARAQERQGGSPGMIANFGTAGTFLPYQINTNSFYVYGVASANFNGAYVWNNAQQTYTNNGTGSYCFFVANDVNLSGPGWFITNTISHLWDDFDTDVPTFIGGSENKFPILPLNDGDLVYTVPVYNIAYWIPTNTAPFTNYTVVSPSSNSVATFTNPVTITGTSPSLIVGNNNHIQIGASGNYIGNPSAILGGFNNFDYGFNSGMLGGHDNTNYGEGSVILGSAGNLIVKNQGEVGILSCEGSVWNDAGGNSGGAWDLFCTNNGANQSGMIDCFQCTLDGQSVIAHCVTMLSSQQSYMNIQHGIASGLMSTNIGYGVYSFGDFNQVNCALNFGNFANVFGPSNNVSVINTVTLGAAQTNTITKSTQIGFGNLNGISMAGTSNVLTGLSVFTGGFNSRATNDLSAQFTTTGITNANPTEIQLIGVTGVTGTFKCASGVTYSLGTITVPSTFVLQVGDAITFASGAAKAGIKPI